MRCSLPVNQTPISWQVCVTISRMGAEEKREVGKERGKEMGRERLSNHDVYISDLK